MGAKRSISRNAANQEESILVTVMPAPGHIDPMLAIACRLRDRGHSIIFNTADVFQEQVESEGIRFAPLIGKANFDYRTFNKFPPEGQRLTPGPEEMNHNLMRVFGDTMLDQCNGIRNIKRSTHVDLILADFTFFGILPELLGPRTQRPPIISIGISPIVLSSSDTSPLLGPAATAEERERNIRETAEFQAALAPASRYLNDLLHGYGRPSLPGFVLDCLYTMPDLFLQLSVEDFEFPRPDMARNIKFAGPVLRRPSRTRSLPEWWKERDESKPLILVTQGTIANADLNELIGPTLAGLSQEDVIVIAATGRPDCSAIMPAPANARVTPFIPFLQVLPEVDVFVTNGGYGAVNQALSAGVPIVIAGETEDKAFVASRIGWSGAGINLRTSRPTAEQLSSAVRKILHEDSYSANARRLQKSFAQHDGLEEVALQVESLLARENAAALAG